MYVSLGLEVPFRGRKEIHDYNFKDFEFAETGLGVKYIVLKRSKMKQYQGGLDQNGDPPCDLYIFENTLYPNLSFIKWFQLHTQMRWVLKALLVPFPNSLHNVQCACWWLSAGCQCA